MNKYNFKQATILGSWQILPVNESGQRQVVISVGIKGEKPVIQTLSLERLQCPTINQLLLQLKEKLDQLALEEEKRQLKLQQQKQQEQEPIAIQGTLF